jgi:hypothetical protein
VTQWQWWWTIYDEYPSVCYTSDPKKADYAIVASHTSKVLQYEENGVENIRGMRLAYAMLYTVNKGNLGTALSLCGDQTGEGHQDIWSEDAFASSLRLLLEKTLGLTPTQEYKQPRPGSEAFKAAKENFLRTGTTRVDLNALWQYQHWFHVSAPPNAAPCQAVGSR